MDRGTTQSSMGAKNPDQQSYRVLTFFLVYGLEAVLPAYLIWLSPKIEQYEEGEAEETRRLEINMLEEVRDSAIIQNARYQQGLRRHYDKSTQPHSLKPGDSVL